jgi:chaperonin GroEL
MAKQVSFDEEALHFHKQSMDTLAEAVRVTLGPRTQHGTGQEIRSATVINVGVTIAREIALENPCEDVGV